jgi:hypothetical protein
LDSAPLFLLATGTATFFRTFDDFRQLLMGALERFAEFRAKKREVSLHSLVAGLARYWHLSPTV